MAKVTEKAEHRRTSFLAWLVRRPSVWIVVALAAAVAFVPPRTRLAYCLAGETLHLYLGGLPLSMPSILQPHLSLKGQGTLVPVPYEVKPDHPLPDCNPPGASLPVADEAFFAEWDIERLAGAQPARFGALTGFDLIVTAVPQAPDVWNRLLRSTRDLPFADVPGNPILAEYRNQRIWWYRVQKDLPFDFPVHLMCFMRLPFTTKEPHAVSPCSFAYPFSRNASLRIRFYEDKMTPEAWPVFSAQLGDLLSSMLTPADLAAFKEDLAAFVPEPS